MTNHDRSRHPHALSEAQMRALAVLHAGGTQQQAADEAGVARQTANDWARNSAAFIAERNFRKNEAIRKLRTKADEACSLALDVVCDHLAGGSLAAASLMIKLLPSEMFTLSKVEPEEPEKVEVDLQAARRLADLYDEILGA